MVQRTISFEWRVVDDEEVWRDLPVAAAPHTPGYVARGSALRNPGEQGLLMRTLRTAVLVFVGLVGMTGASFSPNQPGRVQAQNEIKAAVQLEELAWKSNNEELYRGLLDDQVNSEWQREWRAPWGIEPAARRDLGVIVASVDSAVDTGDELMLVKLLVTQPAAEWWRVVPYRETRFYRQTEEGWVRTLPTSDYWGELRTLDTPHLRFEFYDWDAATVVSIANRLELVYLALYDRFQLPPPATATKLTLAVVPDVVRTASAYGDRLRFTTPMLTKVPQGLTDGEQLAHQIVSRFTSRVLNQTLTETGRINSYGWQNMFRALRGWVRTEVLAQRSPWHLEAERVFSALRQNQARLRLSDINDSYASVLPTREQDMWEYMVAESVVAYAINAYGWERLPAFVQALGEFGYWSVLIPHVFGVSVEDFEDGWNRYLAEHYQPLDLPQLAP